GARFTYAALARADLKKLDLAGVDLTGAYLFLAQLDGADLSRASGLKQDQLSLACGTSETKLPAGMAQPDSWPCRPESD
ncbi:MAG: pentapeptide repeat-containing protein, partial [Gemmatimonadales bacterium]